MSLKQNADETIVIEYQLSLDDIAKLSIAIWSDRTNKKFQSIATKLIQASILIIVFLALQIVFRNENLTLIESLYKLLNIFNIFFTAFVFFIFLLPNERFNRACVRKSIYSKITDNSSAEIETKKIIIQRNKINLLSKYISSEIDARKITSVEIFDGDFYIFWSEVSAIFIPSRFFKSEEHKNEVFQKCQQWFSEANKEGQNVT